MRSIYPLQRAHYVQTKNTIKIKYTRVMHRRVSPQPHNDDPTPASTLNTPSCLSLKCFNCVIAKASAFTRFANATTRPSALRRPSPPPSTSYPVPRANKRRARSNRGTARSPVRPPCASRKVSTSSSSSCIFTASHPIAVKSLINGRRYSGQSDSVSGMSRTPRKTTLLLLDEAARKEGEVETERMASATAPRYAWGGLDWRRDLRDGVLESTLASAA